MKKEIIVVSVGGSLITPDSIDISFIKKFRELILKYVKRGKKFIIICGGGKIARRYQEVLKKIGANEEDIDWIGIDCTILNAQLMKMAFRKLAHPEVINNPTQDIKLRKKEKIIVASGWKPGCSTDYDAVLLAKNFHVKKLVNLTNIDYVYDKDPKKFKDAKPIKEISWKKFREILPSKWSPGLNTPLDPIAAKIAQKFDIKVAIMNGKNLKNFENYLKDKDFIGTLIK